MGIEDKLNQAKGALKEGAGKLTGDKKTEIEGAVEKVVEKAKDGIKYVKEGVDDAFLDAGKEGEHYDIGVEKVVRLHGA